MPTLDRFRRPLLLILFLCAACAAAADSPRSSEPADLPADAALRQGTLPNGLHFAILPNSEPKGRASLRLLVMAGSLHENESQRGLAHFLEHMAFNGSTHFPPGELVRHLQKLGMGFGNDTNAYTTYDHTAYQIELPDASPTALADGLRVLGDYAGGLLLLPEEIERERGIVLSEKRDRDGPEYRTFVAELGFLLPGLRHNARHTIGDAGVLAGSKRDDFADFYDTWYRPERMTVVAVGDFDPEGVERQLRETLGSLQARAPERVDPGVGALELAPGPQWSLHAEPEAAAARVSISLVRPERLPMDSLAERRRSLAEDLAASILSRRLEKRSQEEGAPFSEGAFSSGLAFDGAYTASIDLVCRPERWQEALGVAENELRRALEHGFTADEVAEAKARVRRGLEEAARAAPTRRSEAVAGALVHSLVRDRVFLHPAENLRLALPQLESFTAQDLHQALAAACASPVGPRVFVTGNLSMEDASGTIAAAYNAAARREVTPPQARAAAKFDYDSFGAPGTVAERREVEDLGVSLVRFANGVRLNIKPTPFEAKRVRLSARIGYGRMSQPADQPGLAFVTDLTFTTGGLGRHDWEELRRILAGRTAEVSLGCDDDAFILGGGCSPEDLKLSLQLMAAYITDPGLRPEAFRIAREQTDQVFNQVDKDPQALLQAALLPSIAGGDPRLGLPTREQALARTAAEVAAWVKPQLAAGPLELSVVGDISVDAVVQAVSETLGALPQRSDPAPDAAWRRVPAAGTPYSRVVEGAATAKAMLVLHWRTADLWDISRTRRLNTLASVFNDRVRERIREELGDAYSPTVFSQGHDAYEGLGWIAALVETDPSKIDQVRAAVAEIARNLVEQPPSADEVKRATQPALTGIKTNFRNNGYWLGNVLSGAQAHPQRLEWPRTLQSDYESITPEDLHALAQRYLAVPPVEWLAVFRAASPPPRLATASDAAADKGHP